MTPARGAEVSHRDGAPEGNFRTRLMGLRSAFLLGCGAAVAGVVVLVGVLLAPGGPPGPGQAAAAAPLSTGPGPTLTAIPTLTATAPSPAADRTDQVPPSAPVTLRIPSLHLSTTIINVGLNADRTPQVPPLTAAGIREVGWYDLGPTPGEVGAAVIVGHVDAAVAGRGSFYNLGTLVPGQAVSVTLTNGATVDFTVTSVREYPKDHFPVTTVYGPTAHPTLRLITCGGRFDSTTRSYLSNIVVYATKA